MADDKDNETPETPDDAKAQAPDAAEADAAQADAPEAAEAEAPAADEPAAEEASTEEPAAGEPSDDAPQEPQASDDAAPSDPEQELSPKQRRRLARSKHDGEVRPSRTSEERHAERQGVRKAKAVRRRARRLQERAKAAERRAAAPAREPLAPVHAPVEGSRRMRQGIVISDKAAKTITVRIDVARRHRRYEKIVRSSTTLHAHDENNDAHEGDVVRVIESRPLSRSKRWALVDVLERAR
jgi:small subunit ribosomal protein S17